MIIRSIYIYILLLFCLCFIIIQGQTIKLEPRVNPGCALIQSTIYCYGGYTRLLNDADTEFFGGPINEHIALNLDQFDDHFSNFNNNTLEWKRLSNTIGSTFLEPIGYPATATLFSDNSYVIYGGYTAQTTKILDRPFLQYDPKSDTWKSLPLSSGNNYTTQSPIINLGNDTIWMYGGYINSTRFDTVELVNLFDYKMSAWIGQIPFHGPVRIDHTATLASNGIIYVIGGLNKISGDFKQTSFNVMHTYNTQTLSWRTITANGKEPSLRVRHSTTEVPDKKVLIIYGGKTPGTVKDSRIMDYCYVYDIISNSFTACGMSDKSNTRFGHFAVLYKSKYLLLSFGYINRNTPADSLTIIDVSDPYLPKWISSTSNPNNIDDATGSSSREGGDGKEGPILNLDKLIPAIVVPVIVIAISTAIGTFFFIRRKVRREKKDIFEIEKQDPRRTLELQYGDSLTDCTNTLGNRVSLLEERKEICKPSEDCQRPSSPLSPSKPHGNE